MPGEFFFMAIGGLGVSLAGFAGLVAALTPENLINSPVTKWRIGRIVVWGLQLTFLSFGVIAIHAGVQEASDTARLASLGGAVLLATREWKATRPGPEWGGDKSRRIRFMWLGIISVTAVLGNVLIGSVFYLHLIILYMLLAPTLVFVSAIRDVVGESAATQ